MMVRMEKQTVKIPRRRYSETLRTAAPILSKLRNGDRLLSIIAEHERAEGMGCEIDVAGALYWLGNLHHGGQGCPLYRLMGALDYRPGILERGPETGTLQEVLYNELSAWV